MARGNFAQNSTVPKLVLAYVNTIRCLLSRLSHSVLLPRQRTRCYRQVRFGKRKSDLGLIEPENLNSKEKWYVKMFARVYRMEKHELAPNLTILTRTGASLMITAEAASSWGFGNLL